MQLGFKKDSEKIEDVKPAKTEETKVNEITVSRPSGFGDVSIRRMKAKDEDILGDNHLAKQGKTLSKFVEQICGVSEAELEKWPLGDKIFILLEIRKLSKGTQYAVDVKCPVCDKKQTVDIDLTELEIIKLPKEKVDENLHYNLVLPISGKKIKMKILRVADEGDIQKGQANHSANISSYLTMIQTVELEGVRIKNINIFKEMDSEDLEFLREKADEIACGVSNEYYTECKNSQCMSEMCVQVPIDVDFFLRTKKRKTKRKSQAV